MPKLADSPAIVTSRGKIYRNTSSTGRISPRRSSSRFSLTIRASRHSNQTARGLLFSQEAPPLSASSPGGKASSHVDLDVVGDTAQEGVVRADGLENGTGHIDVDRAVRHQPRDEPLPAHAAAQVAVQPEGAVLRAQYLCRADGVGLRRHPAPVAAKEVQRVLHDGHGMQFHTARPGLSVSIHVGSAICLDELIAQVRLPEGDMAAPADTPVADIRAAPVGDALAVVREGLPGREVDLTFRHAQPRIDLAEEVLP